MSLLETAIITSSRSPLEKALALTAVVAINSQRNSRRRELESQVRDAQRRAAENEARMQRAIESARKENKKLVENNNILREHLDQMSEETRQRMNNIDDKLNNVENRMEAAEQQIAGMQEEMNQLKTRFADEDRAAREAVNMVIAEMDAVEKRTLIDRFAPIEAEHVRDRIVRLIESGNTGSVLQSQAEEAMTQIIQMEKDAIRAQKHHDEMVNEAQMQLEAILQVVHENRTIPHTTEDGTAVEIENEFWSKGEYGKLKESLENMKTILNDRYDPTLTEERIKDMTREIDASAEKLEAITRQSVERAVLSQSRMETVNDIMEVMYEQGWTPKQINSQDANYMGSEEQDSDWREGAFAVLENNGQELTVIVNPNEDQTQNQLVIHTSDADQTDEEYHRQVENIANEIGKSGYKVSVPENGGHQAIPELEDTNKLVKKGASKAIKERIRK